MKSLSGSLKTIALVPFAVLVIILSSCMKETINMDKISNTVDWPVSYGLPIAYGGFTLGDIVSAVDSIGMIKKDDTGLLYLLYRDSILSQTAENLLTIPTQLFQQGFAAADKDFPPLPGILDSIKFTRDTSFVFSFNRNDVEIDSMVLKSGILSFSNTINLQFKCSIDVVFPTFKKNGVPLTILIRKNAGAPSPIITDVSMAGYRLSFVKKGATSNLIPVRYNVVINNNKGTINAGNIITTSMSFSSVGFSYIFGYLGQINNLLDLLNQKITLGFFSSTSNYNVKINNPEINLYIQNSFGVPVRVQLNNTRTYSDKTSSYFNVNVLPNPIDIKSPSISQVGKTIFDTIHLTSNIFDAIQTSPHYFYYSENAVTNPLGKTGNSNFFMDMSKIQANMELKIPFDLQSGNLETTDTIPFDIGKVVNDFSILKKLSIYNTFTNSIPFDLKLQVFLTDSNKVAVDSLYRIADQPIIKSGTYNNTTQRYTFSSPHTLSAVFDETRAKKLEKVKYAILKISMSTPGSTYVKFYSDYRLNCAFQVQAVLEVKSLNQF